MESVPLARATAGEGGSSGHPSQDDAPPVSFSSEGKRRTFGLLKGLVSAVSGDVVGLHGGLPPSECYPIASISVTLADGAAFQVPASVAQQQYNIPSTGLPALRQWATQHMQRMHLPPRPIDVVITDSSSHGAEMATALFLEAGDSLLVEEFSYSHFLECVAVPRAYRLVPVPMDHQGIVPEALEALLQRLAAQSSGAAGAGLPGFPKMLYTVPTGHNPTGAVIPVARKRRVYDACRRHGILLLEDDPYAFLQFPDGPDAVPGLVGLQLDSYLSLDTAGLVIRLDSFAKCLAPGLRLGWATAPPRIAERLSMSLQASTLGANMMCQTMVAVMLSTWGDAGLDAHLRRLQRVYAARAAALQAAAEAELTGLAEWRRPTAGMFMWLSLRPSGVEDTMQLLPELQVAGVVVVPGRIASPLAGDPAFKCPWVRIAFSNVEERQLREGVRRLAGVLRRHRQLLDST